MRTGAVIVGMNGFGPPYSASHSNFISHLFTTEKLQFLIVECF